MSHIGNWHLIIDMPRFSTKFMKEYFKNKEITGAEIGVEKGLNAKSILNNLNIKKIYLIDPFENYAEYKKDALCEGINKCEKIARSKLNNWKDKIIWIKKFSSKAVNDVPSNLDFVYIDGNHDYEYVKEDIENYWKKIRVGGVLAGHDIDQVAQAGFEFFKDKDIKMNISFNDWWVVKGHAPANRKDAS